MSKYAEHVKVISKVIDRLEDKNNKYENANPGNAGTIRDRLREVRESAYDYRALAECPSSCFFESRRASQQISKTITDLRLYVLECFENAPEADKDYYADLLDETLYNLWDTHIKYDLETYSKEQLVKVFDSVLDVVRAFEGWASDVESKIDRVTQEAVSLEKAVEKNGRKLEELKKKTGDNITAIRSCSSPQPPTEKFYIPVIMAANCRTKTERKKPVLRIVK